MQRLTWITNILNGLVLHPSIQQKRLFGSFAKGIIREERALVERVDN